MNTPRYIAESLVYCGAVGAFLWIGIIWGFINKSVQADEHPPAVTTLKFKEFELELPIGLRAEEYYVPADNPMSSDKVALGRSLFFDPRLSKDNSVSCANLPFAAKCFFRLTARFLWE